MQRRPRSRFLIILPVSLAAPLMLGVRRLRLSYLENTMGYRRSKRKVEAAGGWTTFVARNKNLIYAAGLPEPVTKSIDHWDDFLMHGYLDHHEDPHGFSVDQLSEQQYGAVLQLVESYFVSGYEYFEPVALRSEDSRALNDQFRGKR